MQRLDLKWKQPESNIWSSTIILNFTRNKSKKHGNDGESNLFPEQARLSWQKEGWVPGWLSGINAPRPNYSPPLEECKTRRPLCVVEFEKAITKKCRWVLQRHHLLVGVYTSINLWKFYRRHPKDVSSDSSEWWNHSLMVASLFIYSKIFHS